MNINDCWGGNTDKSLIFNKRNCFPPLTYCFLFLFLSSCLHLFVWGLDNLFSAW